MGLFDNPYSVLVLVSQYVAIFVVVFVWFYRSRIKRGFRVQFVAEVNAVEKGAYSLAMTDVGGEKDFVKVSHAMRERGLNVSVGKMVELVKVVRGDSPNTVIFLADVEVKAGQEFVVYGDKAFRVPWEMVAFREYGWEYMVINLSNNSSLDFSGNAQHYYDPTETANVLAGKFFLGRFNLKAVQNVLALMLMGVVLAVVVTVVVEYFVLTGAMGFVKIPAGFNGEIVNGTIVGGFVG